MLAAALALTASQAAQIPSPSQHLGYAPGEDGKLADYADVTGYFRKLAASSDRIRLEEFGRSHHGKPMYVAYLSSAENLHELGRWKSISRRMALGEPTPEEARRLARQGKAIVWIDSGLHANEVAPVQHTFDLAYRMVTGEDDETRRIRDNVILLHVPVINPDGLDWIVHWYRGNLGTPYELAPLPKLYQEYAGHDNNRDWFMMNLVETRHVSRLLYREWFPHIVYNQHQAPAFPARIFVPPYAEPLNPNIPAPVLEGVNVIGSAMRERFAREGKTGVLSYHGYDSWWNGGLRTAPKFHNMHGILTETALAYLGTATPREYAAADFPPAFGNGIPTLQSSVFYPRPWMGGKWSIRDAIEYMLTADFAILELAASRAEHFVWKPYELARAATNDGQRGSPYAYVLSRDQWDWPAAQDLTRRLQWAGVAASRAASELSANGRNYPAGSIVFPAAQPFRAYLVDLLDPQRYPELKLGSNGPTRRPYDVAGWTLSMSMGVQADRIERPFEARLEPLGEIGAPEPSADPRHNAAFLAVADSLRRGQAARRNGSDLRTPRVALYEPYTANMDAGWTRYVLDQYGVPVTRMTSRDFAGAGWQSKVDSVILASQNSASILHGMREGEEAARGRVKGDRPAVQRPEYTGGIGLAGLAALDAFVREGGTLITLDDASDLPVRQFGLPLTPLIGPSTSFYCPGSLLRITVDTGHPVAHGMPAEAFAFSTGGHAWDVSLLPEFANGDRGVTVVARYAARNLLASGWVSGESAVLGKPILVEARHGKGRVILFGFRPQFRAQTAGTFKFLLNAVYRASARAL